MTYPESLARGRAALQLGDLAQALAAFESCLSERPDDPACWFLLGATRHRMQDLAAARVAFEKSLELFPSNIEACFALAAVCLASGENEHAAGYARRAVALSPELSSAWFTLAVAEEACSRTEQALSSYDRALALQPGYADAMRNRGLLLLALGRVDDAVANNRQLVTLTPYSFEAQFALGEALLAQSDHPAAASAFRRALNLSPRNAKAMLHAGFALAQCERFADAQQLLDRAAATDPDLVRAYRFSIFKDDAGGSLDARVLFLLRHYDAIERCDWRERPYFLQRFTDLIRESSVAPAVPLVEKALGFRSMAMGVLLSDQLLLARQISAGILAEASKGLSGIEQGVQPAPSDVSRRIRIGYVSPDLRNHPTGFLAADLFAWHDRSRFEVVGYSLSGDDGSDTCRRIREGCDEYVLLQDLNDAEAASRIANDRIDVLVDLAGYCDRSRPGIFARRPVPLQISWLAYVATMGAGWIDYFVGDRFSLPEEYDCSFDESLIRLPAGLYVCCYAQRRLSSPPDRTVLGLPAHGTVLAAMHNPYKIDPECFAVWMRLLREFPKSVLWLLDSSREAETNLRKQAIVCGVDPVRLVFAPKVPHAEHLIRLQQADLALDTPQCNGGTTTADALVAGVPVLSCAGSTVTQRMAGSLLHAAGQGALVVDSLEEYELAAKRMLGDRGGLDAVRRSVLQARGCAPFFDPEQWVRHFEQGLVQAWERHCHGLPPVSFNVST